MFLDKLKCLVLQYSCLALIQFAINDTFTIPKKYNDVTM